MQLRNSPVTGLPQNASFIKYLPWGLLITVLFPLFLSTVDSQNKMYLTVFSFSVVRDHLQGHKQRQANRCKLV